MASRLSVTDVLDTLLDDGFSSDESDDNEGEEIYAYLGESVLRRSELEAEAVLEPVADAWDAAGDLNEDRDDIEDRDNPSTEDMNDPTTEERVDEEQFDDASSEQSEAISRTGSISDHNDRDESQSSSEHPSSPKQRRLDPTDSDTSDDDSIPTSPDRPTRATTAAQGAARAHRRGRGTTRGGGGVGPTDSARRGRGVRCSDSRGRGRGRERSRSRTISLGGGRGRGRGRGRGAGRGHGTIPGDGRAAGVTFLPGEWENIEPTHTKFSYSPTPGPNVRFPPNTRPVDLFYLYFTDDVWDLLVTETNSYAALRFPCRQYARPWKDVTCEEMKAFIGMLIMMGILHLPHLDMYWQVNEEILSTPGISEIMSRDKFLQIYRFLHLADNRQQHPAGHPRHDKLFKVRNLLNLVTAQCASNYTPHQAVTVDEAMIPFKGRLNFKQYMKNKPTKWGIKVFVLCDATNGYIYRMQIYTGKTCSQTLILGFVQELYWNLWMDLKGMKFTPTIIIPALVCTWPCMKIRTTLVGQLEQTEQGFLSQ
ncbi:chimeric ERCC6-PGBD3 protein-like [Dysidea avara]|uniref:chimeric ERCC6-PGBD3 protein-like n=1 Tax=Dysidea avara TaxID=196820 RepID=UPI00332EC2AB